MNNLQIFKNKEFGNIRIIEKDGQPLFCGSDVAKSLGYAKPQNAISQHCRYGTKHTVPHPQSAEKEIEMVFIPEGDLYRFRGYALCSQLQNAKGGGKMSATIITSALIGIVVGIFIGQVIVIKRRAK